jgi:hypothetical protein
MMLQEKLLRLFLLLLLLLVPVLRLFPVDLE